MVGSTLHGFVFFFGMALFTWYTVGVFHMYIVHDCRSQLFFALFIIKNCSSFYTILLYP